MSGAGALARTLLDWIDVPSITGSEGDFGDLLARELAARGFEVERQEVEPGRSNVLARAGRPELVFCTHLDTVPPFVPPREDREFVYGRGACDAKGQALAMLHAGARLLAAGEERVGFLFTVGEETTSDGAAVANERLAEPWAPRWTIVGEPTDGAFVAAHKGALKARLCARGVAGHSSQDVGPSALHELVAALGRLLDADWGEHALLGRGTLNVGRIAGGIAANVVADRAEAELLLRLVEPPERASARLEALLGEHVRLEAASKAYGPVEFHVPDGERAHSVAFGTDAPHLPRWGTPLLYGCGSIRDAHTEGEKLEKRALEACIERHVRTARELLARSDAEPAAALRGPRPSAETT